MFKYFVLLLSIGYAVSVPAPEPKAEAKPGVIAYSSPFVEPALAYSAYSAPLAYNNYVVPSVYAPSFAPYSSYSSPIIVY
ncbi:hypothetical protein WA026_013144 [Henosepilachna vigintioctopunctata]|uniref:Neuropeptide-like 4 n=1 Tax=Henosepilachna vigintioctopunctata TaxID=420089 RepID=A0AAW1UM05_9CUCU